MRRACCSLVAVGSAVFFYAGSVAAQEKCFTRLDNGVDMTGWHRSTTNHHGPGTGWTIENGAFVGRQTAGNQGGILMTDKAYRDVEVIFEVKIDWGCDSGFFFRTTAGDRAYQINIDHLQDSGVGTIYGEGFSQELKYRPYFLTNMGATVVKDPSLTPLFDLGKWSTIWKPTEFNQIRARIEGNPPHLQAWISELQVIDFTDQMQRSEIDATGPLAIQVHSGSERWTPTGSVQFRNVRVRDLTEPCVDTGSGGTAGAGGGAGTSGNGAGTSGNGAGAGGGGAGAVIATGGQSASAAGMASAGGGSGGVAAGAPNEGHAGTTSTSSPSADGSGCGCRAAGPRGSGSAMWILLGLVGATSWSRCARHERHAPSLD
jgi:MYXO-CTERM domain-containing protein